MALLTKAFVLFAPVVLWTPVVAYHFIYLSVATASKADDGMIFLSILVVLANLIWLVLCGLFSALVAINKTVHKTNDGNSR